MAIGDLRMKKVILGILALVALIIPAVLLSACRSSSADGPPVSITWWEGFGPNNGHGFTVHRNDNNTLLARGDSVPAGTRIVVRWETNSPTHFITQTNGICSVHFSTESNPSERTQITNGRAFRINEPIEIIAPVGRYAYISSWEFSIPGSTATERDRIMNALDLSVTRPIPSTGNYATVTSGNHHLVPIMGIGGWHDPVEIVRPAVELTFTWDAEALFNQTGRRVQIANMPNAASGFILPMNMDHHILFNIVMDEVELAVDATPSNFNLGLLNLRITRTGEPNLIHQGDMIDVGTWLSISWDVPTGLNVTVSIAGTPVHSGSSFELALSHIVNRTLTLQINVTPS